MVGSGVHLAGEHNASISCSNQEQGVAASVQTLTLETRYTTNERLALKFPKQIFKENLDHFIQ